MTTVSLRAYNREIEGMIEAGQLDEAIAHCQYIIKTFPMHIDTYLLLGKAFLEARRYTDAADIFARVLMALPDNFVSHVGMSIIRDDEGKLDDAIWHMERAFEVQPSNPAIQGELRRLYGRRDGVEPPKIRLSRDALANMYSQGELFNQAIAEIRAVLAEDNYRPDLQVMLARAYFRAGQKVEAAGMASTLLKNYAYCIEALRILVDVLPGTARSEDTQIYLQRLHMLDPYSAFVSGSAFATDKVPDSAVTLERLDYKAGAPYVPSQASWAASMGIALVGDQIPEPIPSAAPVNPSPEQPPAVYSAPIPSPVFDAPAGGDQSIPAEAASVVVPGSAGEVPSKPAEVVAEHLADQNVQDDIPAWLKDMTPKETPAEANTSFMPEQKDVPAPAEDTPDWLKALSLQADSGEAAGTTGSAAEPSSPAVENEGLPDWLKSLDTGGSFDAGKETSQPAENNTPTINSDEDLPAWLKSMAPQEVKDAEKPPAEISPEIPPASPLNETNPDLGTIPEGSQPEMPAKGKSFTDWLTRVDTKDKDAGITNGKAQISPVANDVPVNNPQEPAQQEPVVKSPTPTTEKLVTPGKVAGRSPVPQTPPTQPGRTSAPDTEPPFQPSGEVKPLRIEDDTLSWLENLGVKQGAKEEELLTKPEDRGVEIPEMVSQAAAQAPAPVVEEPADQAPAAPLETPESSTPSAEVSQQPIETPPDWLGRPVKEPETNVGKDAAVKEEPAASGSSNQMPGSDITITTWLSKMDVEEALRKARASQEPEQPVEAPEAAAPAEPVVALPDWLKDLDKPVPPAEPVQKPEGELGLPDWLRESVPPMPQEGAGSPAPGKAPQQEIPSWIDEVAPVSQSVTPTAPGEWVPASAAAEPTPAPEPEPRAEPGQGVQPEPGAETALPAGKPTIQLARSSGTGMLSNIPVADKDGNLLMMAQLELENSNLGESMKRYLALIKKDRLLDEVIHDLREALYRFPVDIIVWQTLGDAYMRANRLQDALDSYTKAEELLR